ncbi:MAG: rRNA maturation RNase YbeY [Oscillospiraceae bacterium]|nr:rRNA maturation RNase YbeY [Oscillospiraceae bacterium]
MIRHKILITYDGVCPDRVFSEPFIRKCINTALDCERVYLRCEVSVLITDDEGIHGINRRFRDVDRATDVLSFPLQEFTPERFEAAPEMISSDTGLLPLGDIVVSAQHIRAQAAEYGHSRRRELSYLLVHSVMHLLGYDHMDEGEMKKQMRRHEEAVMDVLGR